VIILDIRDSRLSRSPHLQSSKRVRGRNSSAQRTKKSLAPARQGDGTDETRQRQCCILPLSPHVMWLKGADAAVMESLRDRLQYGLPVEFYFVANWVTASERSRMTNRVGQVLAARKIGQ
jgi:hypothetical protein